MSNNSSSSSGITFAGALTILFIGLKLTHFIDWSWLWVLSPLWIGVALVIGIAGFTLLGGGLIVGFLAIISALFGRSRRPKRPFR
jgi:hypothetical protein